MIRAPNMNGLKTVLNGYRFELCAEKLSDDIFSNPEVDHKAKIPIVTNVEACCVIHAAQYCTTRCPTFALLLNRGRIFSIFENGVKVGFWFDVNMIQVKDAQIRGRNRG